MKMKYTVMASASYVGSCIAGYIVGKKVYDVTGNAIVGVAAGATVQTTMTTVSGQVIGQMASNEVLNDFAKSSAE